MSVIRAAMRLLLMLLAVTMASTTAASTGTSKDFDSRIADTKAQMLGSPATTLASAIEAQRLALLVGENAQTENLATAKWLAGEAYLRLGQIDKAADQIDAAIILARRASGIRKLDGDLLLSKGGILAEQTKFAGALEAYQTAYNVFKSLKETRSQAISLVNIGLLYQEAEDYHNALRYIEQAITIYRGDPQLLFSIYGNLGVDLYQLGRRTESQVMLLRALKIAKDLKSRGLEARTLRNIARGQLEAGQLDQADRTIAEGLAVLRDADALQTRCHFFALSAQLAFQRKQYDAAKKLIQRSFGDADLTTTTLEMREAHQTAYRIYRKLDDQHQALIHLEALKRLDDQTSKLSASANTALAAARFDFANQETRIAQLKQAQLQRDVDDAALRAQTQRTIFGGLAIAGGIIVGMLVFGLVTIRRSRNEVRAANVDLAETNAALGKALAAKTEFLATTSHEIRTPLNGILGMTQVMLADATIDPAVRDRITVVHGAGVRMRALVNDILDVAKMETGNLTIEAEPFDLRATLRDVSRLWEEQAHARGVAFRLDIAQAPQFVVGDSARLRQVAFNLLSNALKFTERGSITLRAIDEGATFAMSVEDSGIGIPADKLDLIFESFRQADAGTTRKFGGTGLGLAICRNLTRAMGGDITVTSVPGQGSVFTARISLVRADGVDADATPLPVAQDALLLCDRNPITRSMVRALLEPRAGIVLVAGSVDEAVALIERGGVSQILIDDATIRATADPDAALRRLGAFDAVAILLWTHPTDDDIIRFKACGIDRVIAKPITGAALSDAVFGVRIADESTISGLVSRAA